MEYNLKPKILIEDIDIKYLRKNIFSEGINLIETYPGVRADKLIKK